MPNRWQLIFEITLDIKDGDNKNVVLDKVKLAMEKLITDKDIAHYHVLQQPKVVFEFD